LSVHTRDLLDPTDPPVAVIFDNRGVSRLHKFKLTQGRFMARDTAFLVRRESGRDWLV